MAIMFYNEDSVLGSSIQAALTEAIPETGWVHTDFLADADICVLSPGQTVPTSLPMVELPSLDSVTVQVAISKGINSGQLILPTSLGAELLVARIGKELDNLRKLRDNNPLFLPDERIISDDLIDDTITMAAHVMHGSAVKHYAHDLEKKLDGRARRTLQRYVENWCPVAPMTTDPDIIEMYPPVPRSADELRVRLEAVKDELDVLGVKISKSVMDASQLNVGIPFAGGHNRKMQGLTPPSDTFKRISKLVANIMLRGAALELASIGEDAFEQLNTRVGVKSNNYQGVLLNTTSHAVRQTLWKIMQDHDNNIFYFKDLNVPTVSGFRSQDNGSGKCRASYVMIAPNKVVRTRVLDGGDLEGKTVLQYDHSLKDWVPVTDTGVIGARKRIVGNVWSGQNDSIVPVPAYIAKFKGKLYKALYQQDQEILSRFIAGTVQFDSFWKEGYEEHSWVRKYAAVRGAHDLDSFLKMINDIGEFVICGDVVSFDGNASWEVAEPCFSALLSPQALEVTEKLWNSDKIGVYTDCMGAKTYYYVSCNPDDPSVAPKDKQLVSETKALMSSLPSGIGPTAQAGRTIVPTALLEILHDEFAHEIPDFWDIIGDLPSDPDKEFCFITAFMNSAGDDHNLGSLALWLLTGHHPREITKRMEAAFEKYKTLLIQPEYPVKMNAGWLFHEDDEGRLTHITLSDSRLFANTVYPEHTRSAIGLFHSVDKYISSALGSPIEAKIIELATIIVTKVYGFDSIAHLEMVCNAETAAIMTDDVMASAQERIAALLAIPQNDLEWKYSFDDLIEMGVDEDLLNAYRRPIPEELTVNPFQFLNRDHIVEIAEKEFGYQPK